MPHRRLVTVGTDRLCFGAVELQARDLAGHVPRRNHCGIGRLDEERSDAELGASDDQCPVGRVTVEHHRLRTCQPPPAGLAHRARPHPCDGITGADLFERDGPARRAGRQRCQLRVEAEMLRRQCGEHTRREVRTGERHTSHLLHHDDHVDETETDAPARLGDEQRGPAQLDELIPYAVGEAALVVDHRPHVARWALALEEAAHGTPQLFLVRVEGEIHVCAPYPSSKPDMGVMVR